MDAAEEKKISQRKASFTVAEMSKETPNGYKTVKQHVCGKLLGVVGVRAQSNLLGRFSAGEIEPFRRG